MKSEEASTLTAREIKMAVFLAGECIEVLSAADGITNALRIMMKQSPDALPEPYKTIIGGMNVEAAQRNIHAAWRKLSGPGIISDFTEEEAVVIRKAAGR